MLARGKGVVWEVKQVGMTVAESGLVYWANLVPTTGGEQRAAYSKWTQEPTAYQLDGEAVTFEG
jgi:hypothetical protein